MKKLLSFALALMLMLVIPLTATASVLDHELEAHIRSELNRANFPNAAVAVIQDGETSFILENSRHDTLFQIGSHAKAFTGLGILLLDDMGLLSVTDPVNQHLPWFEVRYNGVHVPHEDITIYNLLHNTSGITSDERRFPSVTLDTAEEFIEQLAGVELAFYPGAGYGYGNANYVILGFLIEAVSGQSYDEFMTQYVLYPLGLYNTFTSTQNAHATGRVIGGHRMGYLRPVAWNPPVSPIAIPTGFIYSSIEDMARWVGIQMGLVETSEQFARVVRRSHEHNHAINAPFTDMSYFYGAGWRIEFESGDIRHGAETPGYTATIRIRPHNGTAVVILGNMMYGSTFQMGKFTLDAIDGAPFNTVGMDLFVILDIVFTALSVIGVIYIGLLIRFVIKTVKRLRDGEVIRANFTPKNVARILDPIISFLVLIGIYVGPTVMFQNSFAHVSMLSPASMNTAIIALWIVTIYSLCSWLVKVFVNPRQV